MNPIANQINSRNQVSPGSESIISIQEAIPKIGTSGTHGVRKDRGASGCALRNTITPTHTNTNASNVPMLVISPTTRAGTNAANKLTKTINSIFDFAGVLNFGFTSENILGRRPSFDMEKNTLD